ncbi:MAG: site-2 protease family protein [candidate division KSB1 bacterium]|nr:site-2 protease family protein [candidate division KSB1 bacterium]
MLKSSLRLGRIAGIEIRLDYSWFIVFVLITWSLAAVSFPMAHPDWNTTTHWTLGLLTSLLFFVSVLAHEMAHSLVAQAKGVPVRSITLFIFGGAAQISQEPKEASNEFLMALAGPATSIFLAIFFAILWFFSRTVNQPLASLASWLARVNLLLAMFNLIPGFPLDGGRVLRAIIWGITRNLKQATQIASVIGRGIAFLFIFAGIWLILHGNWVNGLWIAFIGWFLENAATASYRQVALRDMLQGHTAGEVMTTDCPRVPRHLNIERLVYEYILFTGRRCFPVVDDGKVGGIITLHHVKKVPRQRWADTTIEEIMTPLEEMKKIRPDDDLSEVLEQMTAEDVNQLLVVEGDQLLGLVARDNVLAFIRARAELGI